jgi:hypothetical protein
MLKKVMALVAILVLVLATAQLALAQQYPAQPVQQPVQETPQQRDTSGTQPIGAGQTTPADTPAGQSPGQDQPATPGSQSSPSPAAGLMFLNQNGQLLIDCPAVSNALAQPGLLTQTEQVELQELSQLCADGGFVPANSGGGNQPSPNGTDATQQPQQSQGTLTPSDGGGNNGLGPNDTSSNPPPQRSVAAQ